MKLAQELGVSESGLIRWLQKAEGRLRPVRVIEKPSSSDPLVLVTPGGYRVSKRPWRSTSNLRSASSGNSHSPKTFCTSTRRAWKMMGSKTQPNWTLFGLTTPELAFYHLASSKSARAAREILSGFEGTLVVDGYKVYPIAKGRFVSPTAGPTPIGNSKYEGSAGACGTDAWFDRQTL